MLVYESFPTLVTVAFVAAVVFADRLRDGMVFLASAIWVWIFGVGSYYLVPSLGPFDNVPQDFAGLPHTIVTRTQALYLGQRTDLLADPSRHDAFAQISAFASLHVGVTTVIVLMLAYYRFRRTALVMSVYLALTIVATVYLGWHFFVDDVAGLAIAAAAVGLGHLTIYPTRRSMVRLSAGSARGRCWHGRVADPGARGGGAMIIGVCEDDAAIRRLLAEALRFAGHETVMAHDGGEALRRFGTDSDVDVLVVDIGLPDSDGRDVCQALRSAGQNAPVLFLTALGATHDRLGRLRCRRGRLRREAVRDQGADRATRGSRPPRPAAALDEERPGARPGPPCRPHAQRRGAADADRVPDARRDHVATRRGRPAAYRHCRSLAGRSCRGGEHRRLLPAPHPDQAAGDRLPGVDRDGAWRRVPPPVRRPHLPRSFRQQIVILTASVTAVSMLLLTLVLQLVLAHITDSDINRVLQDRVDTVISSAQTSSSGELVVPDAQLDAGVAVYDDQGTLVAGSVPDHLTEIYADLMTTEVDRLPRLRARPGCRPSRSRPTGGATGVVVVTERLEPYEEAERLALIVSLVTGVLTTLVAAAIAAWATRRALRPVAVMAETATEWSEHDLSRRFDLGPPHNEISALAATLDQLLDKVSSAIRSEQRLTSELAHELRTPLTTIQGMADLVLLRDVLPPEATRDLTEISEAGQRMAATITALLELARNDATLLAAGRCSLTEVLDEIAATATTDGVTLTIDAADVALDLPQALAVRAISPVVENALRFARERVVISTRDAADPGQVEIVVDDDGPGSGTVRRMRSSSRGRRRRPGPAPASAWRSPDGSRGPAVATSAS